MHDSIQLAEELVPKCANIEIGASRWMDVDIESWKQYFDVYLNVMNVGKYHVNNIWKLTKHRPLEQLYSVAKFQFHVRPNSSHFWCSTNAASLQRIFFSENTRMTLHRSIYVEM